MPDNNKNPTILNASATLLGLCFIVLTSLKVLNVSHVTVIDEITTLAIILFMASSIMSFMSLRGKKAYSEKYETLSDIIFLIGIVLLFITTVLIAVDVVK